MAGIDFPTLLNQLDRIERQNPDYALYVYEYDEDGEGLNILRETKNHDAKMKVTILLLRNEYTQHYSWISDFNRVARSEVTKHHGHYEFCLRCFCKFKTKEKLEEHLKDCSKFGAVRIEMPEGKDGKPPYLNFSYKKYNRKMLVTFCIYPDIESILKKIKTCQPNSDKSFAKQYQLHEISSFSLLIKSSDDESFPPILRTFTATSDDMGGEFIKQLDADIRMIYETVDFDKPLDESTVDKEYFENATHCHVCERELHDDKVLDHCHFTGRYRGAAHNKCNLHFRLHSDRPCILP